MIISGLSPVGRTRGRVCRRFVITATAMRIVLLVYRPGGGGSGGYYLDSVSEQNAYARRKSKKKTNTNTHTRADRNDFNHVRCV